MGIEERINVTGADEAKRSLDSVADAQHRVAKSAEESGDSAQNAAGQFTGFGGVLDSGLRHLLAFTGGLVGARGLSFALRATAEDAKVAREALVQYVDAMAATLALTKDPQFLEIASKAAIESGRPIEEIGASTFAITSSLGRDPAIVESILTESIEIAKTEPNVKLDQVIELLVRLRKLGGPSLTAQQAQNFAIKTEEFSTANIGDLAEHLPRLLGVGGPAGLGFADIGALFAVGTGPLSPAIASTAISNIISGLANPKSADAIALFKAMGIAPDAPFDAKLQALAARHGHSPLTVAQNQALVGEGPGAALLPVLLAQLADFNSFRDQIEMAMQPGAPDLGAGNLSFIRQAIPGFSRVEATRQAEQNLQRTRRESPAADAGTQAQLIRTHLESILNEMGIVPYQKAASLTGFDIVFGMTGDPVMALTAAAPRLLGGHGQSFLGSADLRGGIADEIVSAIIAGRPPSAGRVEQLRPVTVINNVGTQYNDVDPVNQAPRTNDYND